MTEQGSSKISGAGISELRWPPMLPKGPSELTRRLATLAANTEGNLRTGRTGPHDQPKSDKTSKRKPVAQAHQDSSKKTMKTEEQVSSSKEEGASGDRRLRRNEQEKLRSQHINVQFDKLQKMLSHAGVVVPRGTKGCVLDATQTYVRFLQERNQQLNR